MVKISCAYFYRLKTANKSIWRYDTMKRISFTMTADNDGKITVTNTLKYIMQNVPQIKVPDADITKIPLATLTLAEDPTKHCVDGYASGLKWDNGRFVEYEFTLIFR